MAAQTTAYWDKDIFFIGCLIICVGFIIKNSNDFMNKSFSGQTFKCEEPHMNFFKVSYVCGTFNVRICILLGMDYLIFRGGGTGIFS